MPRAQYRNGEDIALTANGCDGCKPASINGVLCHETGCPDAWKDRKVECFECGTHFYPVGRFVGICDDCADPNLMDVFDAQESDGDDD